MNSLFALLTSTLQTMEPAASGMELVGSRAILERSLVGVIPDGKIAEIDVALQMCAKGDAAGLDLALKAASPTSRADLGGKISAVAECLEDLFALRTAIRSGGSLRAHARLAHPLSLALLRSLQIAPADAKQPGLALVGTLEDGAALVAPPPQGPHRLLRYVSVAYDSTEPGPLLSIASLPSAGVKVLRVQERRSWRQRPAEDDDLRTWLNDSRIFIATRPIPGPVTLASPNVQIDVAPNDPVRLYATTLHDESKRLLFTYIRAFPVT